MPFPALNLDSFIQYFVSLGSLPFSLMLTRLFLDGGWIPVVFVAIQGFWALWVQSRMMKYAASIDYVLLAIDIPRGNEQTPKAVEQIFSQLAGSYSSYDKFETYWLGKFNPPFSLEIASVDGYVQFLIRTPMKFRDLVEAAFYSQYPDAEITEVSDYTVDVPRVFPHPEWDLFGTEFVLKAPHHLPIRTYLEFEHSAAEEFFKDPISGILESMSSLKRGEQMWLQILIVPTDDSWKKKADEAVNKMIGKKTAPKKGLLDHVADVPISLLKEVGSQVGGFGGGEEKPKKETKSDGDQFKMMNMTPGERSVLEAVQIKLSKTGFLAKMRLVYAARRDVFSKGRVSAIRGALALFSSLNMNGLKNYGKVTPKTDYPWQRWEAPRKQTTIRRRFSDRSNKGSPQYILNTEELATLYHFPYRTVKAPLVKKTEAKRAEPPSRLPTLEQPSNPFKAMPKREALPPAGEDEDIDAPEGLPFA
jgi:hypothetical protein